MGMAKEVQVKDRKIKVHTIKTASMMTLQGDRKAHNLAERMLASLSDADRSYLEQMDYEGETTDADILKLIEAWKDVNPESFRKEPTPVSKDLPLGG